MDTKAKDVVREMTLGSDQERISFPEVVRRLMEAGVERYHADLVAAHKTYYMPDGGFETVPCHETPPPAPAFSAKGVEAAVRAIQAAAIGYREFCARIAAAGCAGYFVTLAGRRAVYYGRAGETFVEPFLGAP